MGVRSKHVEYVLKGGGQVGLQGFALTREKVSNVSWHLTTAREATATRLICPVSPEPT